MGSDANIAASTSRRSLETDKGTRILQPVLSYGYNGVDGWQYSSWTCCPGGNGYHSDPIQVAPGDSLHGSMEGSSCDASGACEWSIVSADATTSTSTKLNVKKGAEVYVWAGGGSANPTRSNPALSSPPRTR